MLERMTEAPIQVQISGISPKNRKPKRLTQMSRVKSIGMTLEASESLIPDTAAKWPREPSSPIKSSQKKSIGAGQFQFARAKGNVSKLVKMVNQRMMLTVPSVRVNCLTITSPMPQQIAEKRTIMEPELTSINPGRSTISTPVNPSSKAVPRRATSFSPSRKIAAMEPKRVLVKLRVVALASSTTLRP